jgi:pimeloyl-ACP methyl ester carboxylesterase
MFESVEPGAVLFLHGVGLDPRLFDPLMALLPHRHTTAPLRTPYDRPAAPPAGVVAQATELAELLGGAADVTVVGVSGGATLALALAMLGPPGVVRIVAHEPLVGPLAPDLHAAITASAAALEATPGPDGVFEFLARLVGADTWAGLPAHAHRFAADHAGVVRAEARSFAAFAPSAAELAAISVPLVVTAGARSHPRRRAAAARLGDLAPVRTACIADAGHLVHIERPEAFAEVIEASAA